ncbi:MAG: four helix bundle protein [Chloroflexi bacterium]|nr:four helix bundle protein [Chloroflexota bacterium]
MGKPTAARPMSYEDTEIYKLARRLAGEVHKMTYAELPKNEQFEEASQIRRSSKSIVANFVEGFGMRRYKAEFVYRLTKANAECDETKAHLQMLLDAGSLRVERFDYFYGEYQKLGRMLYNFRESVIQSHQSDQ